MVREQTRSLGLISVMRRDFAPGQPEDINDRVLELFAEPLAMAQREGLDGADLALEEVPSSSRWSRAPSSRSPTRSTAARRFARKAGWSVEARQAGKSA
jgi:hypothetical protein